LKVLGDSESALKSFLRTKMAALGTKGTQPVEKIFSEISKCKKEVFKSVFRNSIDLNILSTGVVRDGKSLSSRV
jgi:hypothetical protein